MHDTTKGVGRQATLRVESLLSGWLGQRLQQPLQWETTTEMIVTPRHRLDVQGQRASRAQTGPTSRASRPATTLARGDGYFSSLSVEVWDEVACRLVLRGALAAATAAPERVQPTVYLRRYLPNSFRTAPPIAHRPPASAVAAAVPWKQRLSVSVVSSSIPEPEEQRKAGDG